MQRPILRRGAMVLGAIALVITSSGGSAVAQPTSQSPEDVFNDPTTELSPGLELLRPEDVTLTRRDDGIAIEVTMDVPTPGTYVYPDTIPPERQAAPEAFTLWTFIFNYPEHCTANDPPFNCGGDDFTESVKSGIYGLGAHVPSIDHSGGVFEYDRATDGRMTFIGEVLVGDPQRPNAPPGEITFPLENPMGAEIHFAVAPHGQIDPATLAIELYEPAGEPDCGCWWGGLFAPEME